MAASKQPSTISIDFGNEDIKNEAIAAIAHEQGWHEGHDKSQEELTKEFIGSQFKRAIASARERRMAQEAAKAIGTQVSALKIG